MNIIGGKYKGFRLLVPKNEVRPTLGAIREAIFNICQHQIQDVNFLDLFAGSGAMGLEALSRGARHATFVDTNITTLQKNIDHLHVEDSCSCYRMGAAQFVHKKDAGSFDLIYVDPPYVMYEKSIPIIEEILSTIIARKILAPKGTLFLEAPLDKKGEINSVAWQREKKWGNSVVLMFSH